MARRAGEADGSGEPSHGESEAVYVSSVYPSYSETFVSSEMAALQNAGWRVSSYSLRPPPEGLPQHTAYAAKPVSRLKILGWVPIGVMYRLTAWRRMPRLRRSKNFAFFARSLLVDAHAARLRRAIRSSPSSAILHAHFLAHTADVALRAAGTRRVVVTVHAADGFLSPSKEHMDFVARVSGFRFASEAVFRTFGTTHSTEDSLVLPCVADLPEPRTGDRAIDESILRVVTIARLVETKGYAQMVRVIAAASERGPVEWTIVGDGPMRDTLSLHARDFASRGVRVLMCGALPHQEALRVLDSADVFLLLPVVGESDVVRAGDGLPVALMEAMARGIPVVTTPAGGIPELVIAGRTGVLVDPNDIDSVVRALWDAGRTDESAELVRAASTLVREKFAPGIVGPALERWLAGHIQGVGARSRVAAPR